MSPGAIGLSREHVRAPCGLTDRSDGREVEGRHRWTGTTTSSSDGAGRGDRDGAQNAGVLIAEPVPGPIAALGAVLAATLISEPSMEAGMRKFSLAGALMIATTTHVAKRRTYPRPFERPKPKGPISRTTRGRWSTNPISVISRSAELLKGAAWRRRGTTHTPLHRTALCAQVTLSFAESFASIMGWVSGGKGAQGPLAPVTWLFVADSARRSSGSHREPG